MILPASQAATLALLVISLICWGIWANTLKLAGKWRFELYFYDFALGFVLLAMVAAFTAGSLASSELTFQENFLIASYRNLAYVIAAGIIFNVGNMLLTATISLAGMALAFSVAGGVALTVVTVRAVIFDSPNGMLVAVAGVILMLAAVVLAAYAYSTFLESFAEAVKKTALAADPRAKLGKRSQRSASAALPVALGAVAGIALGLFRPLLDMGRTGDNAVAPYGLTLLFAASILGSTIVLGPFFFNFPVAGAPVKFKDYFSGTGKQHVYGLVGGVLAGAAFLTGMLALAAPPAVRGTAVPESVLREAGPVLAALCGLFLWRELKGTGERPRLLVMVALILLLGGIAALAISRG
jgi:glucose uptake protein